MRNISVKLFFNSGHWLIGRSPLKMFCLILEEFKDTSTFRSGGHFVQQSGTICAILVEGIMWNNHVTSFYI